MKLLKILLITILFFPSGDTCGSMDSIPMDLLGSLAPQKKLHNKIAASVSGPSKKPEEAKKTVGEAEAKAKEIEQKDFDKDSFVVPKIPVAPKDISEDPVTNKKAILPGDNLSN